MSTTMVDTWTAFGSFVQRDPGGKPVAVAGSDEMATQIAREHNAHQKLVEACEEMIAVVPTVTVASPYDSRTLFVAVGRLRSALAAAKGDPNG